jgi:hypothetical protein
MMCRIALLAALASAAFAQQPAEAPPSVPAGVDQALRARIEEFYRYHVSEEYRKAEKLVAEDSQDVYYIHNKPKYEGFEIKSIEYLDNFTKAKVALTVEQYVHGVGFEGKLFKMPSTCTWKLVDGKWFWYADPEELARGPMGKSGNAGTKPGAAIKEPDEKLLTTPDVALNKVTLDKDVVVLKPHGTAEVNVTNGTAGTITLALFQVLPDIKVTFQKTDLNQGEKTVVTLKGGENPNTGMMGFSVFPTNEVLSFDVKRQ